MNNRSFIVVLISLIFCSNYRFAFSFLIKGGNDEDLLVTARNGKIRGQYMYTFGGRKIRGFLSIPYAEPPLGKYRFKPPEPVTNWTGIKDGTQLHPACVQTTSGRNGAVVGSEDCLYLNVYTPLPSETNINNKTLLYPVMFWIHGSDWNFLDGGFNNNNPRFLLDQDVILISFNYRLGALGFLTTGDLTVPGNIGLKDQNFALKWVQENIRYFGGDPNSVTLFGESAGGASVRFHMYSPLSKGLFHGAISQSGTALCNWSLMTREEGTRIAKKIASNCKCPTDDTESMIECLRKVDATKIIQITQAYESYNLVPISYLFKPVIEVPHEGAFLDDYPWNIMKQGRCSDVPNINGVTPDEGAYGVVRWKSIQNAYNNFEYNFERIIPYSIIFDVNLSRTKEIDLSEEIRGFYFGNDRINETSLQNLIDIFTDTLFFVCAVESTKLSLKYFKQPTYFYYFAYKGTHRITEIFGDPHTDYGVGHAEDELYLFDKYQNFNYKRQSDEDYAMADWYVKVFTDFATYRNPTPSNSVWLPVSTNNVEYLDIRNYTAYTMKSNLWKRRLDFWYYLCDKYNCKYKINDM